MKPSDLLKEEWRLSRSGLSVIAGGKGGGVLITQQPTKPELHLHSEPEMKARATLLTTTPRGYRLAMFLTGVQRRVMDRSASQSGGGVLIHSSEWGVLVDEARALLSVTGDL